jgi:hypothetical protein
MPLESTVYIHYLIDRRSGPGYYSGKCNDVIGYVDNILKINTNEGK